MHSSILAAAVMLLAASSQALVLPRQQQQSVAAIAGGGPPNSSLPASISSSAIADFGGVNFLENLESAFFEEGLKNLTNSWNKNGIHNHAIEVVTKVQAQEAIHVQTAEGILMNFNQSIFSPCKYDFPVSTADEFFALANIITSVGIGAVIEITAGLAVTDPLLIGGTASILAIEARHDAFFRAKSVSNIPNPTPFDTGISTTYALNLGSPFVVPGSCARTPSFTKIPALSADVKGKLTGSSGPITFTFDGPLNSTVASQNMFVGWVNQANAVNYQPATVSNGKVQTTIPAGLGGLAFAALTAQNQAADVNSLTAVTLAGPAPVQIS